MQVGYSWLYQWCMGYKLIELVFLCFLRECLKILMTLSKGWRGLELSKRKMGLRTKVALSEVCCPKKEGGLGIRSFFYCNKASMIRHLWNIASKKY